MNVLVEKEQKLELLVGFCAFFEGEKKKNKK